jgi:hypothetical protein
VQRLSELDLGTIARSFDPGDERMGESPYEVWAQLRSSKLTLQSEQLGGFHILCRYDAVRAASLDYRRFLSGEGITLPPMPEPHLAPIEYDPAPKMGV